MWLQHSHWHDTTKLCSGDERGCEEWLTESLGVRYAQERAKNPYFKRGGGSGAPRRLSRDNAAASEGLIKTLKTSRMVSAPHNSG